MQSLLLPSVEGRPTRVMCIGAHADDIEIGCAGTLLQLSRRTVSLRVTWVVLSGGPQRLAEAHESARSLLGDSTMITWVDGSFTDGRFPAEYSELKAFFEQLKEYPDPDLILTHRQEDRHQDHRLAGELTWSTFRDHLIWEYEVPKFDGDLGQPNLFVALDTASVQHKERHLMAHFASQRSKDWFTADTFRSLMRLRGLECRAPSGFAEGFYGRKTRVRLDDSPNTTQEAD
jgi:LmbE family N-acetylglucosaminyl deacetylase